jgi:hypothetical protein
MRRLLLALVVLTPAMVFAQGPFDGVWRLNLQNTQYIGKENYRLQNGMFQCSTCDPKIDTKADGTDHPLTGSPYADALNVRVVDDRTVAIVFKKGGKVTGKTSYVVSQDGQTLSTDGAFTTQSGQEIAIKYPAKRVEAGEGSAHRISGVWQPGKLESLSENVMLVTYKTTGDSFSMSDKAGNSYTARFDGKDYPYKGDPGITTVSIRKVDANTIEETFKRDGKPIGINRMTVAANGREMSISFQDKVRDVTIKWTADKQ